LDGASACTSEQLYGCHRRLPEHKEALFKHLMGRWRDLFNVSFEVLLYDLTSTYVESDPRLLCLKRSYRSSNDTAAAQPTAERVVSDREPSRA
jgi:hypothetical protein